MFTMFTVTMAFLSAGTSRRSPMETLLGSGVRFAKITKFGRLRTGHCGVWAGAGLGAADFDAAGGSISSSRIKGTRRICLEGGCRKMVCLDFILSS